MREPTLLAEVPQPLDHELLAWAAGLFDGEGSTVARSHSRRPNYHVLQVSVPQSGHTGKVPDVLVRFQAAVLGAGRVETPNKLDVWTWRSRGASTARRCWH